MKVEYNVTTADPEELGFKPPKKNNWKILMGFLVLIGVGAAIFAQIYRERPKRFQPMKKRTIPATRSVYACILSPLNAEQSRAMTDILRSDIAADSATVNMVLAGTAIYHRFISSEEFTRNADSCLKVARPADLKIQAQLLSQITGIIVRDTLPTKLYLIGSLGSNNFEKVAKRVMGSAEAMVMWSKIMKPMQLELYLTPPNSEAVTQFTSFFKNAGVSVRVGSIDGKEIDAMKQDTSTSVGSRK